MRLMSILFVVTALLAALPRAGRAGRGATGAAAASEASSAPSSSAPAAPRASLTLQEFMHSVEDRLVDVQRVELRQTESRERVRHVDASRFLELQVEGTYQEDDLDRLEINGAKIKSGRLREYNRDLRLAVTHPLLGRSLEDRMLIALEEQRQIELEFQAELQRRASLREAIDLYLSIYEGQEAARLLRDGVAREEERVRILTLRDERGESLHRDALAARAELAERRLDRFRAGQQQSAALLRLARRLEGPEVEPFVALPLDWEALAGRVMAALAAPPGAGTAPFRAAGRPVGGQSLWYTVPEIDLRFAYSVVSLDRTFADEQRRERGHSPEVRLTLEMPLDFYRSARAFKRQVEARRERRRLNLLTLERRLSGERRTARLALEEAVRELELRAARQALYQEDLRVARLRAASGEEEGRTGAGVALLDAELAATDAEIALLHARGLLARRWFAYELAAGRRPAADVVQGLQ